MGVFLPETMPFHTCLPWQSHKLGVQSWQEQGLLPPLVPNKVISATHEAKVMDQSLCILWVMVLSLGALVGWYCCSHVAANPFSSINFFSKFFLSNPILSSMGGSWHSTQYLSCSDQTSQETAITGSVRILGISNIVCAWWIYIYIYARLPGVRGSERSLLQSLLQTFSPDPLVWIFYSRFKEDWSICTMIILLIEIHLVSGFCVGYSELLGQYPHITFCFLFFVFVVGYLIQDDIL